MGHKKKEPDQGQDDQASWEYKSESDTPDTSVDTEDDSAREPDQPKNSVDGRVEWSASEFIHHEKGFGWYVLFTLVITLAVAIVYFLTHDMFSIIGIVVLAIIAAVVAARKPRVLEYRLDNNGITIGQREYAYQDFKSFTVIDEGPFRSIVFVPMKRFALPINLYLAPEDEAKAVDVIGRHLPLEHGRLSGFDQLMRHARF